MVKWLVQQEESLYIIGEGGAERNKHEEQDENISKYLLRLRTLYRSLSLLSARLLGSCPTPTKGSIVLGLRGRRCR